MTNINEIAAKSLGDSTSYAVYTDKVDPALLNFMPRDGARKDWGITGEEFDGFDLWHGYEATFLLDSGQPVAGTIKVKFPVANTHVVESKSFKLYLNTFDMCKMGSTFKDAIRAYEQKIQTDIAEMSEGRAICEVRFFSAHVLESSMRYVERHPLANFSMIKVPESVVFDDYTAQKSYITPVESPSDTRSLIYTNALRSRCRHTKQKDSGSAFLHLEGRYNPVEAMKQIVSLREVNEFHEFCAEKLFVEFSKGYKNVGVYLLYSRRGSLDIHPVRYAKGLPLSSPARRIAEDLGDMRYLHNSIFGQ